MFFKTQFWLVKILLCKSNQMKEINLIGTFIFHNQNQLKSREKSIPFLERIKL